MGALGHILRSKLKQRLHGHVEQTQVLKNHRQEEFKEKKREMLQHYHMLEKDMEEARETLDALKRKCAEERSGGCVVFKKSPPLSVTTSARTHSGGGSTSGSTSGSSTSGSTRDRRASKPTQTSPSLSTNSS